jgi:HPt (histidine-containing phosphotransfer) domain-containing protein
MMRDAGAEEAVDSILATFVADAPGRWTALSDAFVSGIANDIRQAAHAYKSSASTIRAHALATCLLKIELHAYDGRVVEARALAADTLRESDAAVAQLIDCLPASLAHA